MCHLLFLPSVELMNQNVLFFQLTLPLAVQRHITLFVWMHCNRNGLGLVFTRCYPDPDLCCTVIGHGVLHCDAWVEEIAISVLCLIYLYFNIFVLRDRLWNDDQGCVSSHPAPWVAVQSHVASACVLTRCKLPTEKLCTGTDIRRSSFINECNLTRWLVYFRVPTYAPL